MSASYPLAVRRISNGLTWIARGESGASGRRVSGGRIYATAQPEANYFQPLDDGGKLRPLGRTGPRAFHDKIGQWVGHVRPQVARGWNGAIEQETILALFQREQRRE